jgi:hypothetical protein
MPAKDTENRQSMRAHFSISNAEISYPQSKTGVPGSIRDISAIGAYVYADLEPEIGASVSLRFAVEGALAGTQIKCDGTVIRVEKSNSGSPTGIAIQFTWLEMAA